MTTMRNVDHTHPHTDEPFGDAFRRGPDVAADGGKREATEEEPEEESMEDVDHEAPNEGANRTFERGTEGRDESV